MSTIRFEECLDFVMKWEGYGVYTVPGENFITAHGLASKFNPEVHADMTWEEAKPIYFHRYWQASGAPDLESPLDLLHFDTYVNIGPRANRILKDSENDLDAYMRLRIIYYTRLGEKWERYKHGWLNRCIDLTQEVGRQLERRRNAELRGTNVKQTVRLFNPDDNTQIGTGTFVNGTDKVYIRNLDDIRSS